MVDWPTVISTAAAMASAYLNLFMYTCFQDHGSPVRTPPAPNGCPSDRRTKMPTVELPEIGHSVPTAIGADPKADPHSRCAVSQGINRFKGGLKRS
jgi:hypothetical protein